MTSLEARKLLDRNELIEARGKSRIFGNCDTPHMRLLQESEIIFLVMKSISFTDRVAELFEKNDTFYQRLKARGLSE